MKILLTMNLPYTRTYGGANRSNRCLAEALAARHHALHIVVPALAAAGPMTHQQLLEDLAAEGIRVSTDGGIDAFHLNGVDVHAVIEPSRLCGYLVEQIREYQPDWTLVSSEDRSQALLEAALKTCPSRVIYLAHTPQMFPFGPAGLYPGRRRTELIGRAAKVVTISRFVAGYIRKWAGFEPFVHHPPHYGSGPFPPLGGLDNPYVLMMNACAVKGISIFLALARALPQIQFAALPGWGTTTADVASLRELSNVTLLENCKNLDDVLDRTRALLMPSLWLEGFGMAVVDAMLRGIPVLASNYGGLAEAKLGTDYLLPVQPIEEFEDRLEENLLPAPVVPPQDSGPWQDALSGLLSDRALYERQSAAAREAASKFVTGLSVDRFEDLLLHLAAQWNGSGHQLRGTPKEPASSVTLSDTSRGGQSVADLTPEQQALLVLRLRKKASTQAQGGGPAPPIERVPRGQGLPLSFAQRRLWIVDQLNSGSTAYNIPQAVRLSGALNVEALRQELEALTARHESLRTTFASMGGSPVQVIAPTLSVALPVRDLDKSGDVARYRPDGNIEFLGRVDQQVKIRGFRIELAEIETVLRQHREVQETVVMAREDVPGDKRLVAYVVAKRQPAATLSELRCYLKQKLPDYMVPSAFVSLNALPLTPSGKVDRRALPAPDATRSQQQGSLVEPRDSLELQLVQIWEEILGTRPIGVTDNFFELGGHSLLALRLVGQIEKQFGRRLSLSALFQGATIDYLAGVLRRPMVSAGRSPVVGVHPKGSLRPFFCVHPAGGYVLCYLNLARHLGPDQPFYGLQHPGLENEQELYTRIEEMAGHYIGGLRAVQPEGPYLLGGWSLGGMIAFEMAQQLRAQGQNVALLALLDARATIPKEKYAQTDDGVLLLSLGQHLGLSLDGLTFSKDHFLQVEPGQQMTYILEQARAAKLVPSGVGIAQLHHQLQVLKTSLRAGCSYAPRPYPGRVVLFRASERAKVALSDPSLGWGELVGRGVEIQTAPGDHYTMLREPHVRVLAQGLRTYLQEVQA